MAPTAASPLRRLSENRNPSSFCPICKQSYEEEHAKLVASESEKPSTPLPAWLQNAKVHRVEEEQLLKKKTQDLQKKWNETCLRAHPQFHQPIRGLERTINPAPFSMTGLCSPKPNPLLRPNLEPKSFNPNSPLLQRATLQLKPSPVLAKPTSPPASSVRTELALGREPEKPVNEGLRDFLSCIPSDEMFAKSDTDSFKKLLKGLTDAAWWQKDAASALASIVSRSKPESRANRWILFGGPDRVGKKKMVHALSDYVCGSPPIVISFGPGRANDQRSRGKTPLDRIAEGVRRDPFSVIMLEDVDEADMLVRGSIKRAMERGRISDSHGREINLGSVTFILTANWSPDHIGSGLKESSFNEEKLVSSIRGGWQLRLSISEKTTKRRANWLQGGSLSVKPRTDLGLLGFDLNETADDQNDGSRNSSDLTTEHEIDLENRVSSNTSVYRDLLSKADDSIIFKSLDFESMQEEIAGSISKKFVAFVGDHRVSIDVEDEALERILGAIWLSGIGLEEWIDNALVSSFDRLKTQLISSPATDHDESVLVKLEYGGYSDTRAHVEWLPARVEVAVDGL